MKTAMQLISFAVLSLSALVLTFPFQDDRWHECVDAYKTKCQRWKIICHSSNFVYKKCPLTCGRCKPSLATTESTSTTITMQSTSTATIKTTPKQSTTPSTTPKQFTTSESTSTATTATTQSTSPRTTENTKTSSKLTSLVCSDDKGYTSKCRRWKNICSTNEYVKRRCRHSCDLCQDQPKTATTTFTESKKTVSTTTTKIREPRTPTITTISPSITSFTTEVTTSATTDYCKGKNDGLYPCFNSCRKYITCANEQSMNFHCPSDLLFDYIKRTCVDKSAARCYAMPTTRSIVSIPVTTITSTNPPTPATTTIKSTLTLTPKTTTITTRSRTTTQIKRSTATATTAQKIIKEHTTRKQYTSAPCEDRTGYYLRCKQWKQYCTRFNHVRTKCPYTCNVCSR